MHHAHLYTFTALHATIRVSEGFSRSAVLKVLKKDDFEYFELSFSLFLTVYIRIILTN